MNITLHNDTSNIELKIIGQNEIYLFDGRHTIRICDKDDCKSGKRL
jgi:hypothetical protein